MFEPLPFEPSYRKVASAISERIMDRRLTQGATLPTELELATQFAVNRSTVREALRELESHGLVARRKGSKRLVVARPATEALATRVSHALVLHEVTVADVWATMMILEPAIAETAARQRTALDMQALLQAVQEFRDSAGDEARAIAAVVAFFSVLVAATGNQALVVCQEPLLQLLRSSLRLMLKRAPRGHARIALAQRCVVEAIEQRDAPAARLWMEKHVRDFRRGFQVAGIDLGHCVRV